MTPEARITYNGWHFQTEHFVKWPMGQKLTLLDNDPRLDTTITLEEFFGLTPSKCSIPSLGKKTVLAKFAGKRSRNATAFSRVRQRAKEHAKIASRGDGSLATIYAEDATRMFGGTTKTQMTSTPSGSRSSSENIPVPSCEQCGRIGLFEKQDSRGQTWYFCPMCNTYQK